MCYRKEKANNNYVDKVTRRERFNSTTFGSQGNLVTWEYDWDVEVVAQGEVMPLDVCGQQPTYSSQKKTLGWCAVVSCARELILLFCFVLSG
jgi:hypothetical protein